MKDTNRKALVRHHGLARLIGMADDLTTTQLSGLAKAVSSVARER